GPFIRAGDDSRGELATQSQRLRVVVVSATSITTPPLQYGDDPRHFVVVAGAKFIPGQVSGIKYPLEHDQRTHTVYTGEIIESFGVHLVVVRLAQRVEWNQNFCSDLVAPAFVLLCISLPHRGIGEGAPAEPEMGELVDQGEDLRRFRVCTVD